MKSGLDVIIVKPGDVEMKSRFYFCYQSNGEVFNLIIY